MNRFILLSLGLAAPLAALAVPLTLTNQGYLEGSDGEGLTGSHDLTFSLYADATATEAEWSETVSVEFSDGAYSAILGNTQVLDEALLDEYPLFLALKVDSGAEMTPRHELSSVPYAVLSETSFNVNGGTVNATSVTADGITATSVTVGSTTIDSGGISIDSSPVIDASGTFVGDPPAPADLGCSDGELQVWDDTESAWACGTESDPAFAAAASSAITSDQIDNWTSAYDAWVSGNAEWNGAWAIFNGNDVPANGSIGATDIAAWSAAAADVAANASTWDGAASTVSAGAGSWDGAASTVSAGAGTWDSTASTVSAGAGTWDSTASTVSAGAGTWDSTASTVSAGASTWDSTASTVSTGGDDWDNAASFVASGGTVGGNTTVSGSLSLSGLVDMGSTVGTKIRLWGTSYAIGIQSSTQYFRTASNFAWFRGGVHSVEALDPGTGGVRVMSLDNGGNLSIGGKLTTGNGSSFGGIAVGVAVSESASGNGGIADVQSTTLGPVDGQRLCFLTRVRMFDEWVNNSLGECQVHQSGGNWVLTARATDPNGNGAPGDVDVVCEARCMTW